uniref:LIM and calponin homology domains 1 n=1 Tax=Oncorhynchus tshawytscha TaxID=74940 RepID=A0AAZ3RVY7_ONCTS
RAKQEGYKDIRAVTGRCFNDKDFRGGLENGILLCELLSSIKPGLVKKINRLPTPIAGLDNLSVFLRGCEELGLKGSQLFDPGDLQDISTRPNAKVADCSRKLKNVLITIYWLGRAANSCTSYNGPTLDLKEFEGLLSQMRKEAEDTESPQRSIRDSGYIDCWDSERSDSLSPPRHGREDSFDSLDSFGSRSRQTPSPDVVVALGIGSDGRGSDSESDAGPHGGRKLPDVRKDDMLARRTSVSEPRVMVPFNQYLPNKSNASGYMPTPLRRKRGDHESREEGSGGSRKSWSTATSPIGGDIPFSPTELPNLDVPPVIAPIEPPSPELQAQPQNQSEEQHRGEEEMEERKEEEGRLTPACPWRQEWKEEYELHSYTPPQRSQTPTLNHRETAIHLTVTAAQRCQSLCALTPKAKTITPYQNNPQLKLSHMNLSITPSISLSSFFPLRSVSMIDMRCEEDAILPHHSQVRHELMHNQYNMLKEEEDHWQDDLARWKSRRRSVSQDLIKKEEERKMMEKLMTGDGGATSQRRKSIKTYREIVEEKERRENDLREAYRLARTPEEAALVLHRYAQRFTISEAVLERLQLPKLLDRSISEDPTATTNTHTNGPLKYLRQQSLPAPKFTATVEAQVVGFPQGLSHRPQIRSRKPEPNPSIRAVSPKSVPLLMPKPYNQPKGMQMLVDGLLRVNGDMGNDEVTTPESEGRTSPLRFYPSPATPTASSDGSDTHPCEATPPPTHSPSPRASPLPAMPAVAQCGTGTAVTSSSMPGESDAQKKDNAQESTPPSRPTSLPSVSTQYMQPAGFVSVEKNIRYLKDQLSPLFPFCGCVCTLVYEYVGRRVCALGGLYQVTQVSSPVVAQAKRGDRWFWDPNEERKRQERWQQEQERMLQEKYQHEQEKLKQEWERAQREVEDEERRYHEEERRILEETVAPLTPLSSTLPSPIRGDTPAPMDPQDTIVRSLADWERKQELLERQGVRGEVILVCCSLNWVLPCRSVSGKKLCSSCGHPLGKGAAMIIETLSLYFHIQCFKCGVCKGQLGDTTTGTDVRIRNGLLNCHQCYIRSRCESHKITSPHAHTRIHICILSHSLSHTPIHLSPSLSHDK